MSTGCDSNEQRKCIETPVKTNICLVTVPLFVPLRNAFAQQGPRLFIRTFDARDDI